MRPDGFIAFRCAGDLDALECYLAEWFPVGVVTNDTIRPMG